MQKQITRIEIFSKIFDTRAEKQKKRLADLGLLRDKAELWMADVYTINKNFSGDDLEKIASMLTNPVISEKSIKRQNEVTPGDERPFDFAIEIGFLPGVTDNIANTTREGIEDLLKIKFKEDEGVYSSQLFYLQGNLSQIEVLGIADSLYNPLIQRAEIKDFKTYSLEKGMDFIVPKVNLKETSKTKEVNLDIPDEDLKVIGKSGISNTDGSRRGPLALDLDLLKAIREHFRKLGRKPKDIELESIAQAWSEHCKHTIFADPIDEIENGIFKTYIKGATEKIRENLGKKDFCVSVFTDNSGAIAFDENYLITHKAETHNSPSALDPFGGSVTGIVGVNRDTLGFGLGAKPVANFYGFCLADPRTDVPLYKSAKKKDKMLSSQRIMEGVIAGVNSGGNQSGIPTPQGFIYFNERYRGKPLIFVGTVGLIPRKIKDRLSHEKKAKPGDYVVMIGGRVGKDGIHGATFSSEALDTGSPATAVQLGDPITQKKLSDALIKEARDQLLYNSITDNGAGGISCSVTEMAKESGGCIVNLEKVPLKYPNLEPWEIWISESQERMTLAVEKEKWKDFSDLMEKRGVEATVIGEFTNSGKCVVLLNNEKIMDLEMDFLHNGKPKRAMKTKEINIKLDETPIQRENDLNKTLAAIIQRLNITSYEFISQQYDYIVQGSGVLGPLHGRGRVNGDASVFRPVLSSKRGVVLSQALFPTYSEIDPYLMAGACIDTAIRNAVAIGANPEHLALLDNFCWSSGNDPERLWQLKRAAKACYDFAVSYSTPYVSGKDSMFNDFNGFDENGKTIKISVPPTLLISSFGVVEDIEKTVSLDAKFPGDLIYLMGETFDELGGSEYLAYLEDKYKKLFYSSKVPALNDSVNKKLYHTLYTAIQKNLIASSISVRHGGLGVALAKKAIGGGLGIKIDLKEVKGKVTSDESALFSESLGRVLLTVAPKNKDEFEELFKDTPYSLIGKVTREQLIIMSGIKGGEIMKLSLAKATEAYRKTFRDY